MKKAIFISIGLIITLALIGYIDYIEKYNYIYNSHKLKDDKSIFPIEDVSSIVYYRNLPIVGRITSKKLSDEQQSMLLSILSDAGNFHWGETTWSVEESEFFFKFFNTNDDKIGEFWICWEGCGMTDIYPHLSSTRYGGLSEFGKIKMAQLLASIVFNDDVLEHTQDRGILDMLDTMDLPQKTILNEPIKIYVHIDSIDNVFLNDSLVSLPSLETQLENKMKNALAHSNDSILLDKIGYYPILNAKINVTNALGTTYDGYIAMQTSLKRVYINVRDSISLSLYKTTFEELSDENRKVIKTIAPMNINEAEPIL